MRLSGGYRARESIPPRLALTRTEESSGLLCWPGPVTLTFRQPKQEDHEFESDFSYTVRPCLSKQTAGELGGTGHLHTAGRFCVLH